MSTRLEPLDSLRGLAALTVLSQHVLLLMPQQGGWLWRAPFYNGHEAVLLFFVLSGFVLYLPWLEGRPPGTQAFLAKRVCRIYLPYVAALAASAVGMALVYGHAARFPTPGLDGMWQGPPPWQAFLAGLDLLFAYDHPEGLITVTWTLGVEARVSLVFPWLATAFTRWPRRTFGLGVAAGALVLPFVPGLGSLPYTVHYGGLFLLGMAIAHQRTRLVAAFQRLGRPGGALAAAAALAVLYKHASLFAHLQGRVVPFAPLAWDTLAWRASDDLAALGVGLLIVAVLASPRASRVLEARPLTWLGRISYALYLLHMAVLAGVANVLAGHASLPVIGAVAVVAALGAAWAAHHLVERPAMALGRAWARRLAPGEAPAPAGPAAVAS